MEIHAIHATPTSSSPNDAEFQEGVSFLAHADSGSRLAPSLPAHRRQHFPHHVLPLD